MNEKVREFMTQWFEDFCYATETDPKRYEVHTEMLPTENGIRHVTTIVDTVLNTNTEAVFNPADKYDYRLGVAIAWARQFGLPLPSCLRSTPQKRSIHKMRVGMKFIYDDNEYTVINKANERTKTILTVRVSNSYDVLVMDTRIKTMVEVVD